MAVTSTVTGNIRTITNSPDSNGTVQFGLTNWGSGNIPRILGTGTLVVLSTTVTSDANGDFTATIVRNDQIDPSGTFYAVSLKSSSGRDLGTFPFLINSDTVDLNSATPITTAPVVPAPTGDSTYQRLDGGNQPTGNYVPSSTGQDLGSTSARWDAFLQDVTARKLNNVRYASQFSGADAGAQIAAAISDLPTTGGTIIADFEGTQSGASAISVDRPVHLIFGATAYTGQITATASLTLEGLGPEITTIRSSASPVVTITGAGTIARKFTARNIEIEQTSNAGNGIELNSALNPHFENVHIQGPGATSTGAGLIGLYAIDGVYTDLRVEGFSTGVDLRIGGTTRSNQNSFYGAHIENNLTGVQLREADGTLFSGSLFQGNTTRGVLVAGGGGNSYTFDTCWFETNGIDIEGAGGDPVVNMRVLHSRFPGTATFNLSLDIARGLLLVNNEFNQATGTHVRVSTTGTNIIAIGNIMDASATNFSVSAGALVMDAYNGPSGATQTAAFTNVTSILPNATGNDLGSTATRWDLFAQAVDVGSGIAADGGGFKHSRVSTGSIAASSSAAVTVTWSTALADANYTITGAHVVESTSSTSTLHVHHIESITASQVVVRIVNDDASNPHTGTLHVTAVHD